MDKAYNHLNSEADIYKAWEDSGAMRADETSDKPPFTIPLPPPNVTGELHLGHAAMLAIQDIMTRYKKMQGHEVLWLPGTDHAAIATENVVIKHHGKKSREQWPTREAFMGDAKAFADEKHDNIVNQMKRMGSWLDWSREAYTFDEPRNFAVNKIFKDLYKDGLIERGYRLINWSTGAQSVISDDELEYDEVKEPFYYIKCGKFIMGTVRPETKCANSPLIVHPDEDYVEFENSAGENYIVIKRLYDDKEKFFKTLNFLNADADYKVLSTTKGSDLVGQKFSAETYAGERDFFVLADAIIDPEKGSGAMTISASHSADDYDLAKRLKLDEFFIQKINFEGNMTDVAGPVAGMFVKKARNVSGKLLEEKGLLVGKDANYSHRVPLCYRSNCVVEPMISPQWFIMVEKEYTHEVDGKTTLKKQMQAAVRGFKGEDPAVQIIPERFNKEYFRWIDNLQDWCISRQIWWGHRIPVWYDEKNQIHLAEEQEIIFARHGESEGNRDEKVQGLDDPLTDKGRQHATDMVEVLKSENVGVIVSGTSARNTETADIIAVGLKVEVIHIEELSSYDTKEVAGMTIEEIGRVAAIKYCKENGKGEDFDAFVDRLRIGLEKLRAVRSNGKIVFVTNRSIYSVLQVLRDGGETSEIFEKRSKNSKLPHGLIDRWPIFQAPDIPNLRQDEDTLDTWFSSALWPFSTLGWPNNDAPDLQKFYNNAVNGQGTDVLETGWDILFFWVARMIMFGRYATNKFPFHTVYLHGMVTDEHGKKMSKSKGNGIDPIGMIEKFGADPVRLALVIGSSPGNPIPIGENKIKGYRNFVNKLWNATRFVSMQSEGVTGVPLLPNTENLSLADAWILSRLSVVSTEIANHLEAYEISAAGDKIYHFVWNEFCNWYLEASKVEPNLEVLRYSLAEILKLTHPLCPFITEQCWQELFDETSLMDAAYPVAGFMSETAIENFGTVQNIVGAIRTIRAEKGLNPKDKTPAKILWRPDESVLKSTEGSLIQSQQLIEALANLSDLQFVSEIKGEQDLVKTMVDGLEIFVEVPFDEAAESARIEKLKLDLEKKIAGFKGRLSNASYTDKAPERLVAETRKQLEQAELELKTLS